METSNIVMNFWYEIGIRNPPNTKQDLQIWSKIFQYGLRKILGLGINEFS
jgi:hypothetical protein